MNGEDNELLQLVTTTYGPLLRQKQLAELLKRSHQGLRYSLHCATDAKIRALKACSRRVGRRVYYPAPEVARIITGHTMKLGQSIGHKHGSKLAQCALADWRIRRCWRSHCLGRLLQGSILNSICASAVCRPDRLSLPVRALHSPLARPLGPVFEYIECFYNP